MYFLGYGSPDDVENFMDTDSWTYWYYWTNGATTPGVDVRIVDNPLPGYYPRVTSDAECKSLELYPGADLVIKNGATLQVQEP